MGYADLYSGIRMTEIGSGRPRSDDELRGITWKGCLLLLDEVRRLNLGSGRDRRWLEEDVLPWNGLRPIRPVFLEQSPFECFRCLALVPLRTGGTDLFPMDVEIQTFRALPYLKEADLVLLVHEYLDGQRVGGLPAHLRSRWADLGWPKD